MLASGFVQQVFAAGVAATVVLDVWQRLAKLLFGTTPTNWALVGRWFAYLPQGRFVHDGIGGAKPIAYETATGWIAHYAVGLIYAAIYLAMVWFVLGTGPTFASALGFGLATVVVPWLVLQPGMGMGIFARKASRPGVARLQSLSSHAVFGVGLYLGTLPLASA